MEKEKQSKCKVKCESEASVELSEERASIKLSTWRKRNEASVNLNAEPVSMKFSACRKKRNKRKVKWLS